MTKTAMEQLTSEFEINDAPLSARNLLTRGHVQDEIRQISGCAVTTRGRYMTAIDRVKNPNERALYLFIQGPNKHNLDLAIQKIDEIIRSEQLSGGSKFRNNPHYSPAVTSVEKVYVGIENVSPGFDLRGKLIGVRGTNLNYIRNETGAIVTLRGKGSLFIDPNLGTESSEPLHLYIEHTKYEGLLVAKQLALNLIETLQQEVAQTQPQVIIQPQTQTYTNQNQIGIYSGNQPATVVNFKPNAPPPQLNIPPPGVHIPTQQGPLITQPPPQQQITLLNTNENQGNANNMLIASNGQLVTSIANNPQQTNQNIYSQQSNQLQNVQQLHPITIQQQYQPQQIFQANRANNIESSNLQESISTQYQMQQNTSQIVGLNNVTQLIPSAQTSVPQMQIVQTTGGQPLHILSPQTITPHFVQPQLQMQTQSTTGTIQQINTIQVPTTTPGQQVAFQVPTSTPGQVAFQIPIQTQNSTQFLQQQNIQQTSVLLAQQNIQPQTITNIQPAAQFQIQQQSFQSHQIPILPTANQLQPAQSTQTQNQYMPQGQMGVYTTQGLVLVQSNQNLQISAGANFNPQLQVANNQPEITTMPVQMNLPPPPPPITATVHNAIEAAKATDQNIILEQVQSTNADNVQINTIQRCSTIQNETPPAIQVQHIPEQNQENTQSVQQLQPISNYTFSNQSNPIQQSGLQTTVGAGGLIATEQKHVPSYLLMQPLQNIPADNSNQMILSHNNPNIQNFPTQIQQSNTPIQQHQATIIQQELTAQQLAPPPSLQNSAEFQQQDNKQSGQEKPQHILQEETAQTKKRKLSETADNSEAEPQPIKKSGVGIDQGKSSTNYNQKGNLVQPAQPQPISGPSSGNQKQSMNEKEKMENQVQFARNNMAMWRNTAEQDFVRLTPTVENRNINEQQQQQQQYKKLNDQQISYQQSNENSWQITNPAMTQSPNQWSSDQQIQQLQDNPHNSNSVRHTANTSVTTGRQQSIINSSQMRPSFNLQQKYNQYPNQTIPYRANYPMPPRNQYMRRDNVNNYNNSQYPINNAANYNLMQGAGANPRSQQQNNWFQSQGGWM